MNPIESHDLTLGYDKKVVIKQLNLSIPANKISVLIGSNGCGKSTLLRAFARLIKPLNGSVNLQGQDIHQQSSRQVAKELAILPQGPEAPEGLSIYQLVKQGRYPHQRWLQPWSAADEHCVLQALQATQLQEIMHQPLQQLSGGQRQRAWIAMTLAQDSNIILLDEPTTYLDLTHQIEVLDLLYELNQQQQKTIVMVLHDLNLACRYADHIIAVKQGEVFTQGSPHTVITPQSVQQVFNLACRIVPDPLFGTPMCVPFGKGLTPETDSLNAVS